MEDPRAELVAAIRAAFAEGVRPREITRCSYDRRNGGQFGTCGECHEMQEFFQDKDWRALDATALHRGGQADGLFEVDAYVYFLPAFLLAAIGDPREADVLLDSLLWRFGPEPGDDWSRSRLHAILDRLTVARRRVVLQYFGQGYDPESDLGGHGARAIDHLEASLRQGGPELP